MSQPLDDFQRQWIAEIIVSHMGGTTINAKSAIDEIQQKGFQIHRPHHAAIQFENRRSPVVPFNRFTLEGDR